jgi:hypothetical protein
MSNGRGAVCGAARSGAPQTRDRVPFIYYDPRSALHRSALQRIRDDDLRSSTDPGPGPVRVTAGNAASNLGAALNVDGVTVVTATLI